MQLLGRKAPNTGGEASLGRATARATRRRGRPLLEAAVPQQTRIALTPSLFALESHPAARRRWSGLLPCHRSTASTRPSAPPLSALHPPTAEAVASVARPRGGPPRSARASPRSGGLLVRLLLLVCSLRGAAARTDAKKWPGPAQRGCRGGRFPGRFRKEGRGERGGEGPGRAASTLRFGAARDPRAGLRRLPHRRFPGLQQRASPHAPPPLIVRRLTSHLHCWLRQARAPTSRASAGWSRNTGATATTTATLPSAPTPTVRRPSSKPTRISDTDTGSTMAV